MDNSLSESARFAVCREKLKGICEANNLSYVFIKNAYPIKLVIRPLGGVGEQMSMLEEASEDNYISPGASILFTVKDGNLTYRMSNHLRHPVQQNQEHLQEYALPLAPVLLPEFGRGWKAGSSRLQNAGYSGIRWAAGCAPGK